MAGEGLPVEVCCRVLGVSCAGFYAWRFRPPSGRAVRHAWLTDLIREVHTASYGNYGAKRVHAELILGRGIQVGHNAVAMLMQRAGIAGRDRDHALRQRTIALEALALATAFAQAVFGGLGLMIVRVPFAGVLTAVMLFLSIAQIGVVPVLGSVVAWLYWTGESGLGTLMLIWTIVAGTMDNFLRPMLIRRGADLPLLLVFAGVVGGLFAFGLIGIFVGPVILAVADALLKAWIDGEPGPAATTE